jgi:hypothetical protein
MLFDLSRPLWIAPPLSHRTPTIRVTSVPAAEAMVARLTQGQRVISIPAARLGRYPREVRAGHAFAVLVWQDTLLIYSLAVDGRLANLEAVIEINEARHAA